MAQSPAMRTEYLVTGMRTPPAKRNSKLATLGRIFKPWKWRKKKSEKLKQSSAGIVSSPKRITSRQTRDDIIKKGILEIMEKDFDLKDYPVEDATRESTGDPPTPLSQSPPTEETLPETSAAAAVNVSSLDEDHQTDTGEDQEGKAQLTLEEDLKDSVEKTLQALLLTKSLESPPPERSTTLISSPPLLPMPQPKSSSWVNQCLTELEEIDSPPSCIMKTSTPVGCSHISGHSNLFQPSSQKPPEISSQVVKNPTPTGSPHLPAMHMPLPPSRVIEELHRALATKHRQDSFHARELKSSPKKRVEFRTSRPSSLDKCREGVTNSNEGDAENKCGSVKEAEENKENLIRDTSHKDDMLLYEDEDELNNSVISGTLPRKYKKELLAVKLRNRPSKQELEDRNIFPRRTDEERQQIRQQIEIKLSKRLSQRPAVEELERRNILKQRNDQIEQEERREIKQRLTRKLNQRPTVDELRERKILIRFSDYVEVAKAQDYDRRADKPWTRLSAADKAAIRKELNEYKSNEMEVHASSKHLTRYHRP
ncbi:phosphatase and actin regulator 3 isoform X4 [Hyla sarda]|nr:phosphatase and actin regulator 3 isoform X4 [Hyla sarda]XP_056403509.1 phosphatase and actin regulator 3 isoform X4 [Hyla sarda]XP_056403510.1 phosphatase and actin regulator 3 isoform X4 [Hyla sarda]XP_056403511.1 phosphatase and actin regulator 3 isoform X4 [Hyla sarda]